MKFNFKQIIFFLLLFGYFGYAQDDLQDYYLSIKKQLYISSKFEDKLKLSQLFLKKMKQRNSKHFIIKGLLMNAYTYYEHNDVEISLKYIDTANSYSRGYSDTLYPAKIFRDKAIYLAKKRKFDQVIENYRIAETYAKTNNIGMYCTIRNELAAIKSDELGDIKGALEIYKENYQILQNRKYSKLDLYSTTYLYSILGISYSYKVLNQLDSALVYTKIGHRLSKKNNDELSSYKFSLINSAIALNKKDFSKSIDSLNKALPKVLKYNNSNDLLWLYYLCGKNYKGLKSYDQTVKYFSKVDSINMIETHSCTFEVLESYQFLIDYYASKSDIKKELLFTKKFKTTDSIFRDNNNELYIALRDKYEIPRLQEAEQSSTNLYKWLLISLAIVALGGIGFLAKRSFRLKKEKLEYEIKFSALVNNFNLANHKEEEIIENSEKEEVIIVEEEKPIKKIAIPEDTINTTLKKLQEFEKLQLYLESDMNLQKLSEFCNINTKYLSKIINTYKEKSVVNYINDLRIENSLEQMKNNPKLLKFNISVLAEQFGFNNSESFGNAFSKKTGMSPSVFINQLLNKNH
ncbi:MAG: AraC family transcriptional regulator [Limnohabitans sp.]|nr:AraC family transcriptional regulator [Limnohabitans sp.]